MTELQIDHVVNCEGLACPMPVVKTKKAMEQLNPGEVAEVRATDKGSVADLQSWASRTGHQYIGLKAEDGVYRHFLRKATAQEMKPEMKYPHTVSNEELLKKISAGEEIQLLDVREPAEYSLKRIPGAFSIPLGELEAKHKELQPDIEYFVICRTGSRSDLACQFLADRGFTKLKNVVPGMSEWRGPTECDK